MAPLWIELLFLVAAGVCFFVEVLVRQSKAINVVALGLLFLVLALMVPPINGLIVR